MEIGPIPAIRMTPAVKSPRVESEITARFEVEALARAGDDRYTGAGKKAAGAEENDEEEVAEEPESSAESRPSEAGSGPTVSFFA